MIGVCFSGTGNTKHCVETYVKCFDNKYQTISIEDSAACSAIAEHETIILGYPIYFSALPKIMADFIEENAGCFQNKKVFVIVTMGLFSGDGAGCAARKLRKQGATILGGLHLKMPDSIGDEKVLKKTAEENKSIIRMADEKIARAAEKQKQGNCAQDGLSVFHHMAGLLGQRLWLYGKTKTYKKKPDVDVNKCIGCGLCSKVCSMENIVITDEKAVSSHRCTLCYRCFSHCPTQALTILGKTVHEQYLFERYQ